MTDIATHEDPPAPAPVDALAMWKQVLQDLKVLQVLQVLLPRPAPDAVGAEEEEEG